MKQAFALMEAQREGWFRETVAFADAAGGVVWSCPDLFFAGIPSPDDPRTLIVLFAQGEMTAIYELARLVVGRFDRARWQRVVRGRDEWKEICIHRFLEFNHLHDKTII